MIEPLVEAAVELALRLVEVASPTIASSGLEMSTLQLWTVAGQSCGNDPDEPGSILSIGEREAARDFSPVRRQQFALGRSLARLALSRRCEVAPQEWVFAASAFGRPCIVAPATHRDLHFSISHTDGLTACLVSGLEPAAVDIEKMVMWDDLPQVVTRVLFGAELAYLQSFSGIPWYERFYDYWTLKEAYAKARGMGLGLDLSGIEFDLEHAPEKWVGAGARPHGDPREDRLTGRSDAGVPARLGLQGGENPGRWVFQRLHLCADCAAAIAVRATDPHRCTLVHKNARIVRYGATFDLEEI